MRFVTAHRLLQEVKEGYKIVRPFFPYLGISTAAAMPTFLAFGTIVEGREQGWQQAEGDK